MDSFIQFLNIVLPASIVLFGMYLTIKSFLEKDFQKKLVEVKTKNTEPNKNFSQQKENIGMWEKASEKDLQSGNYEPL